MIKKEITDFMDLRLSEVPFHMKDLAGYRFSSNPLTKCDNSPLEHTMLIELNCFMDEYIFISVQPEIAAGEMLARCDFLVTDNFSGQKIIIECDSREWHSNNPDQVESDKIRDAILTSGGYVVLRFVGRDIYHRSKWCLKIIQETINLYRKKSGLVRELSFSGIPVKINSDSIIFLKKFFTFCKIENFPPIPEPGEAENSVSLITGNENLLATGKAQKLFSYLFSVLKNKKPDLFKEMPHLKIVLLESTPGFAALAELPGHKPHDITLVINPGLEYQSNPAAANILAVLLLYQAQLIFSGGNRPKSQDIKTLLKEIYGVKTPATCPVCRYDKTAEEKSCPACRQDLSEESLIQISKALNIPLMGY